MKDYNPDRQDIIISHVLACNKFVRMFNFAKLPVDGFEWA